MSRYIYIIIVLISSNIGNTQCPPLNMKNIPKIERIMECRIRVGYRIARINLLERKNLKLNNFPLLCPNKPIQHPGRTCGTTVNSIVVPPKNDRNGYVRIILGSILGTIIYYGKTRILE